VLIVVAMIGSVVIARSLLNGLRAPMRVPGGMLGDPAIGSLRAAGGGPRTREQVYVPSPEEEISQEALVRAERRNRISEYVNKQPDDAARLLKVWLTDES
jgi:flagellar biosynthesis/type III secretory pathway M-ring protein FliF/YscJ